jgi:hypothetical protein
VSIPTLIGPSQQCTCNAFHYDSFADHLQTCQVKSAASQVHDWVVYRLGDILGSVGHRVKIHKVTPATGKERDDLGSVGHRVKIHKVTPATGKERDDLEIKDYCVLTKTSRTGRSSFSSSYSNLGFHFDSYVLWKITCASYRTVHEHKTFSWCS